MASLRAPDGHADMGPLRPRSARRPIKLLELLVDIGRFLLVAFLLTAVLATAWWSSPTRRTLVTPPDDRSWLPGDV